MWGGYLDFCDLGPYRPSDVEGGSCQQHLNTEGCHYDEGEFLGSACKWCIGTIFFCHKTMSISSVTNLLTPARRCRKDVELQATTAVTCEWASTSDTPYALQGSELDPYYCSDLEYVRDRPRKSSAEPNFRCSINTLVPEFRLASSNWIVRARRPSAWWELGSSSGVQGRGAGTFDGGYGECCHSEKYKGCLNGDARCMVAMLPRSGNAL